MIFFGVIFILSGLAAMIGMVAGGIMANQFFMLPFGMLFGGAFIAAGYFAAIQPVLHQKRLLRKARASGKPFGGIIIDYDDDTSVRINGMPLLIVIVRVAVDGSYRDIAYNTKQVSEKPYPLGASCAVYICEGEAVVDPDSIEVTLDSKGRYEQYLEDNRRLISRQNALLYTQNNNPKMTGMYSEPERVDTPKPYNQFGNLIDLYEEQFNEDSGINSGDCSEPVRYLNGKPVDKYGNPL